MKQHKPGHESGPALVRLASISWTLWQPPHVGCAIFMDYLVHVCLKRRRREPGLVEQISFRHIGPAVSDGCRHGHRGGMNDDGLAVKFSLGGMEKSVCTGNREAGQRTNLDLSA